MVPSTPHGANLRRLGIASPYSSSMDAIPGGKTNYSTTGSSETTLTNEVPNDSCGRPYSAMAPGPSGRNGNESVIVRNRGHLVTPGRDGNYFAVPSGG